MFDIKRIFKKGNTQGSQEAVENVFRYNTLVRQNGLSMYYEIRIVNKFLGIRIERKLVSDCVRCFYSNRLIRNYIKMTNEEFEKEVKEMILSYLEKKKIESEEDKCRQEIIDKLTRTGEFKLQLEGETNE